MHHMLIHRLIWPLVPSMVAAMWMRRTCHRLIPGIHLHIHMVAKINIKIHALPALWYGVISWLTSKTMHVLLVGVLLVTVLIVLIILHFLTYFLNFY